MKNLWQSFPTPFFALAPMEDVTDVVFRHIVASCARPDVFFTEFTNVTGLLSDKGRNIVAQRLVYEEDEHPIVAQIWGAVPEEFERVAKDLVSRGFDGIDINMGCPDKSVVSHGGGSALIGDPQRAKEIINATKRGAGSIPVSVKTRIGIRKIETESWIPHLLSCGIDALTVHGRTMREMSRVPTHWDEIAKAVTIRNSMGVPTRIIGNGDVKGYTDGVQHARKYGVDGVMIGRGIFEDLYAFSADADREKMSPSQQIMLMQTHIKEYVHVWGDTKNYAALKKFFKIYLRGFAGASEAREKAMAARTVEEMLSVVDEIIHTYS